MQKPNAASITALALSAERLYRNERVRVLQHGGWPEVVQQDLRKSYTKLEWHTCCSDRRSVMLQRKVGFLTLQEGVCWMRQDKYFDGCGI